LNRPIFAGFGTQTGPTYESTINYTFDGGNRLTQVVDSIAGTISLTPDSFDRLQQATTPQGTVSYGYDAASRRTSMTAGNQAATSYYYDSDNRLTQITQGSNTQVSFSYDGGSRRTSLTLPNGITESYSYDAASQLTGINYALGSVSAGNLTYTYDLVGRRISVGGSLANLNLPLPVSQTAYDAANELTQWGTATPTYDASGNMLGDGTNMYTWNARNQLISMNSGTESFVYDPFGRRAAKTGLAGTTNYLYDGANPVQEQSNGTPTANSLTGRVDENFLRTDANGTASYLTDALGSTVALTDANAATLAQYSYQPFGVTSESGSSSNPYQYTGRENDGTGLYFYRARYYNAIVGRFISEDPARLWSGSTNFYAYAIDNPISYSDPFGLESTAGRGSCPPKCFAQLKYRRVQDPRAKIGSAGSATHAFWYVQGSDGVQLIISAEPYQPLNDMTQYLDVIQLRDIQHQDDNVSATTWWDSGLSSENCSGVDELISAATYWEQDTIPYEWNGANSNSAARNLGESGGFYPTAPPGSYGWSTPIP
jgi:RHS repeat-associated protein